MNTANLEDATTFLKVVEVGGFAAAARELGVTQSTVSRRVAELERRLGARLLERTTRRLMLTEAGARYGDAVRSLVAGLADAEAGLAGDAAGVQGWLRVTVPTAFGRHRVLPLLSSYARAHPLVRLDIDLSDRYVDLLAEGYDFAVRLAEPQASGLQAMAVRPIELHLCAAPDFLHAHPVETPADLVRDRCLIQRTYAPRTEWSLRYRNAVQPVHVVQPRMVLNDVQSVRDMTLAGHGIAALPDFLVAPDLACGDLVPVSAEIAMQPVPVFLVWPRHKAGLPRVRTLREHLAHGLGAMAG